MTEAMKLTKAHKHQHGCMLAIAVRCLPESFHRIFAMELQEEIFAAFSSRPKPSSVLDCFGDGPRSEVQDDALFFEGKMNRDIRCEDLEKYPDCVFGFSPAAFLYYLPGIFSSSIQEKCPDLVVIHSLISMLDRGNAPHTWDSFFAARWPLLHSPECDVTQKWLLWLSECKNLSFDQHSLSRAFDTVELIAQRSSAYPIAKFRA
jgi:hypothetical protein